MKIGYDAKRYFFNRTGLGNYSRDLVRILENYYPEHTYIKYTPTMPKDIGIDTNIRFPTTFLYKQMPLLWRNGGIVKDLIKDEIDIFHGLSGEVPVGIEKTTIKSIVTIHDLIFLRFPELYKPIDRIIYNKKAKDAVKNVDRIIAISSQTKNDLINFYRVDAEKIDVIYQTCHHAFKTPKTKEQKEEVRSRYNLPQNFVLNVGTIEPRKNTFQIVKAIQNIDIPLVLIGKQTPYADEIKKFCAQHNLGDKVLFKHGFTMEDLAVIYSMADMFIYPSKFEGFGIPIIEALYSGIPVITTNSGVFPEAGGPFSYYVDAEDIQELEYAINSLLSNNNMRNEMIVKGREYVKNFDEDKIATQLMSCYKSIV